MTTTTTLRLSVLAAVLAIATPAAAQGPTNLLEAPRHRQGYYASFGLLAAASQHWDDGEALGTFVGRGFDLRIGQLLTERFGFGLVIDTPGGQKDRQTAGGFDLLLESQLGLVSNLALRAGVGLGVVMYEDKDDPDAGLQGGFGAVYGLGLSYDWFMTNRLTGGWALTPLVATRFLPSDTWTTWTALVGIEITWWSGLPRNQLQLPESEAYKKQ